MYSDYENYYVNLNDVVSDLRNVWTKSDRSIYNPTAFSKECESGNNLMMCCPFHSENRPSFGITKSYPYKYNCFTCGNSGNLISLISHVLDVNYYMAWDYLIKSYFKYSDIMKLVELQDETIDTEEFKTVSEEEIYEYRKKRHSYIAQRGISEYTLQKYEIGYDIVTHSITFPVRDFFNNPLYIVRRSVSSKFFNIPKGAPKESILYGLNYIVNSGKKITDIFIAEGPIDVLSCFEGGLPAVGVVGRMLLPNQMKQLKKAGIEEVTLFLDNDRWGVLGALKTYEVLKYSTIKVNVALYPCEKWGIDTIDDADYKDPNDLLRSNKLCEIEVVPYLEYYLTLIESKHFKEVGYSEFSTKKF